MKKYLGKISPQLLVSLSVTAAANTIISLPAKALTFNFIAAEGTSTELVNSFNLAGNRWSSVIKDDITVNISVGQERIADGSLGYANPTAGKVNLTNFLSQLGRDATSNNDAIAVSNRNNVISRLINNTADSNGAAHLDDSVGDIWLTSANAKALGILGGDRATIDSEFIINSDLAWDYDGDSQVDKDKYDLVTTITHELGHALGIVSGVDILDYNNTENFNLSPALGAQRDYARWFRLSPALGAQRDYARWFRLSPALGAQRDYARWFRLEGEEETVVNTDTSVITDADLNFVSSFDLFRYSATSTSLEAIDTTLSTEAKYFSIDGGISSLVALANGESIDGTQASHTMTGDSIMSPILDKGIAKTIADFDLTMLDVMGWDLDGNSATNYHIGKGNFVFDNPRNIRNKATGARTPEPSAAIALLGVGLLAVISIWQRRQHES
jgi:hypothetical protein